VATWCSKQIYRMSGGLVPNTLIFPALLSLPLMRSAAIGRALKFFQHDSFYTTFCLTAILKVESKELELKLVLQPNLQFCPISNFVGC